MSNPIIPTDPRERAIWVQAQLKMRHTNFAAIGRTLGCTRRVVAMAMVLPSYRQEKAIADALGIPIERLFAERYDQRTGQRLHPVRIPKNTDVSNPINAKGAEAA